MKMKKTKKSWAHAHCVCHVNTTIERRRVSVSFGPSVGTCMLQLFIFFSLARSAAKLYYFLHTVRTR